MYIAAVIAAVLLALGVISLAFAGSGTPLTRCTKIIISQTKDSCLLSLASSTLNASVCNYMSKADVGSCVSAVALASSNVTECDRIKSMNSTYASCIEAVSAKQNDASYCASLPGSYVSSCAYGVASANNFSDISACGLISNETLLSECNYKSYYVSALDTHSPTYCASLPATQNSTLLAGMVALSTPKFGSENLSELQLIANTTPQGYCYYNLALLSKNEQLCNNLTGSLLYSCKDNFGVGTYTNATAPGNLTLQNVSSVCSSEPSSVQQICEYGALTYIAITNGNTSICGMISDTTYRYSCYAAIAQKYHNIEDCRYISNSTIQSLCENATTSSYNSTP